MDGIIVRYRYIVHTYAQLHTHSAHYYRQARKKEPQTRLIDLLEKHTVSHFSIL